MSAASVPRCSLTPNAANMLPVLWRTKARSSLAEISSYIADRNPIAAQRLKDAIQGWTMSMVAKQ
jgi:plasmid stabilization system protein ParE